MSLFIQPHLAPGSIVITWLSHTAPAAPRARRCLGLGRGLGAAEVCPPGAAVGQRMKGPCAVRLGCDVMGCDGMGWDGTGSQPCSLNSSHLICGSVSQLGHCMLFSAGEESLWEPVFAFPASRIGVFFDCTSNYGRLLVFNGLIHGT